MRTKFGAGAIAVLFSATMLKPAAAADPQIPSGPAARLIRHYHMQLVPAEEVWFSPTYVSGDEVAGAALPPRYSGLDHAAGSAIVALETPRYFSALHRLKSDEVWHFYGGAPLQLLLLYPDGHGERVVLGSNVSAGETPQLTVPHDVWQGSAPLGASPRTYSFIGTQLSPAFAYADFEIGYRDDLQRQYPAYAKDIRRLTRDEFAVRPADQPAPMQSPPSRGSVFSAREVPEVTVSGGVSLQELVGRVARDARSASVSIARFTLAPGSSSGTSFNQRAEEVFLVTQGSGQVHLGDRVVPVVRDSTVFIPARLVHSIVADAAVALTFYAISAPAFSPDDYVLVAP